MRSSSKAGLLPHACCCCVCSRPLMALSEGENVAIDYRWGENEPARLPALAAELVRRRVNVIAVSSNPASIATAKATTTIPIVFIVAEDPVKLGLLRAWPGRAETPPGSISSRPSWRPSGWSCCARWCPRPSVWPCYSIRRRRRLPRPICVTWKRLRAPWDCKSGFSTPVQSLKWIPPSPHLRANGPTRSSSAVDPFSPTDASNWPTSRRDTPFPRSLRYVPIPKSAG